MSQPIQGTAQRRESSDDLLSIAECARRTGASRHAILVAAAFAGVIPRRAGQTLGIRVVDFPVIRHQLELEGKSPEPAA